MVGTYRSIPSLTPQERKLFWSKVSVAGPDDCWLWQGAIDKDGYGFFTLRGTVLRAHRVAYRDRVGAIPTGKMILHSRDTPGCCNPAHLWPGTAKDNTDDMMAKGRGRPGVVPSEQHGRAKLTDAEVVAIRAAYAAGGVTQTELALRYGLARCPMSCIIRGATWGKTAGPRNGDSTVRGENVHTARLSPDDVRQIRADFDAGRATQTELAAQYPVSVQQIHRIVHRHTWTHVD